MDTTAVILIILLIVHIALFLLIKRNKKLQEKGLVPYGPVIMVKTRWGIKLIERWGRYKRFWRFCGILSRVITFILMVWIVAILVIDVLAIPSLIGTPGLGIQYALAIPGLNPMLPLVYGWIGLIVAMVIHELAHGMQTKANDMTVESTGLLLFGIIPLGAFVEPNQEQVEKASRRAKLDLYAAGITTNAIAAIITFLLVFGAMTCGVTCDYGDNAAILNVSADSPGLESGIPTTAVIVAVNDIEVKNINEFSNAVPCYGSYKISYVYYDKLYVKENVTLGTFVVRVVSGSPAGSMPDLEPGSFIKSINGQPIGIANDFSDYMKTTSPGSVVSIVYTDKLGNEMIREVTLGNNGGVGYLGVSTNTSGFGFTTPNTVRSIGIDPFYNCNTITEYAKNALSFIGNAISGYSPVPSGTHWWYHSNTVPDDAFWIIVQVLFWIMWLNLILGITNAIPAMPFDGGFLFAGGLDFILEKCKVDAEKRERYVSSTTRTISFAMLAILILVLLVIVF